jgi:phage virion morphogenesis protein
MDDKKGAQVSFDLKEVGSIREMLGNASLDATDRGRLLQSLSTEMESQTSERFEAGKTPDGDDWAKLAEKTLAYYDKQGWLGTRSILVGMGFLRGSITSALQGGAWSVLVGATMEYAAVHQFGFPERKIKARPFLGISQSDTRGLEAITADFLEGAMQ